MSATVTRGPSTLLFRTDVLAQTWPFAPSISRARPRSELRRLVLGKLQVVEDAAPRGEIASARLLCDRHMLFYLSQCARNGITVVRYSDSARGP